MSDNLKPTIRSQMPELPLDLPMPVYKYQRDERVPDQKNVSGLPMNDAASLLRSLNLMGCAASTPIRS